MIFWNSVEIDKPAYCNYLQLAKPAEFYLNSEFENSALKELAIRLRYTPIIMNEEGCKKYPERSKARIKQAIYDCAPQLDYQTFVDGTLEAQCIEYIRGITLSSPHLKRFGATPQQIADFDAIMAAAPQKLYQEIKAAQSGA
jgi:hypothetical protein